MLLKKLFGNTYRPALPDYLVYLEQQSAKDGTIHFKAHTPVLISNNQNTPYVTGARDIFAIVVTEKKVCLEASVHTDYKVDPNPFVAIASALGAKFDATQAAKPSEDKVAQFHWSPLNGQVDSPLWLAIGRIPIDVNSVNRITVRYKEPQAPSGGSSSSGGASTSDKSSPSGASASSGASGTDGGNPPECVSPKQTSKDTQVTRKGKKDVQVEGTTESADLTEVTETKERVDNPPQYSGDFLAANGFFSDSPDDYFAVSFALGLTVASGGSTVAVNGYLLVKGYIFRPILRAGPDTYLRGYEPSLGLFVGSNVSKGAFQRTRGRRLDRQSLGRQGRRSARGQFDRGGPNEFSRTQAATVRGARNGWS